LGWGTHDIFGCDPVKPLARLDKAGLCWLLEGRTVVALTMDTAVIGTRSGATLTFRRRAYDPGIIVFPWEIQS
jgi:hypothetical protein